MIDFFKNIYIYFLITELWPAHSKEKHFQFYNPISFKNIQLLSQEGLHVADIKEYHSYFGYKLLFLLLVCKHLIECGRKLSWLFRYVHSAVQHEQF